MLEFILKLFMGLSASLSATEMFSVVLIISAATFTSVRFLLRKRGAILGFLTNFGSDEVKSLTIQDIDTAIARSNQSLLIQIATLLNHVVDIKHQLNMMESVDRVSLNKIDNAIVRNHDAIVRNHDAINRAISQMDKVDDAVKGNIPEFRGYHQSFANSIKSIEREIALIERTVTVLINTTGTTKSLPRKKPA